MSMKRDDKVQIIRDLLADGQGRFSVADLMVRAGSERRMRSAIFLARAEGIGLEPIRDQREVTHYISAAIGAAQRAAANTAAKTAKVAKVAKPVVQVKAKAPKVTEVKAKLPKGAIAVPGQPTQYDMPAPKRTSIVNRRLSPTEQLAKAMQEDGPAIVAMGKRDLGPEGALEIEEITEQKVA